MKERIQKIIDYKGITPGDLAEILGVQRSNISHILNGRNKPGAVFIEKFLLAFPGVNARWLFTGEGPMIMGDTTRKSEEIATSPDLSDQPAASESESKNKQAIPEAKKETHQSSASTFKTSPGIAEKRLDKVVLLYSDGTFLYYNPS